jgi:DNA polymerase (family 10)
MNNSEIAGLFEELADIMEIGGENYFKIRAYRNAAVTINQLPQDLNRMPPEKISEIPGVGKAISEKIREALRNGTFPTLEKWRLSGYASFRLLLSMPEMNMRTLRTLIKKFNLTSINELKKIISDGSVSSYNGLDEEMINSLKSYLDI